MAQMQSGKTGTYLYVALKMVKDRKVQKVVIISGNTDVALKTQTQNDARLASLSFKDLHGLSEEERQNPGYEIKVCFANDLKKLPKVQNGTLVIHDESHRAQSKCNIPYKRFYRKNKLNKCLQGDFSEMNERNIKILSVSATPFSEITTNMKAQTNEWTAEESKCVESMDLSEKAVYIMTPGSSYVGISEFLKGGNIKFNAEPIKPNSVQHLASVLTDGGEKSEGKYCIVRTKEALLAKDMMETIANSFGYEYVPIFGSNSADEKSLSFMKKKPDKPTLVHICAICRMGQVVPKEHVWMVYEQSGSPNTDTILQGLPGRMCGYHENRDIDIYVTEDSEEQVRMYAEGWSQSTITPLLGINKAMNLTSKMSCRGLVRKDKDECEWIQTVPIRIMPEQLEKDFGDRYNFNKIDLNDIQNTFEIHPELLEGNPDKEAILRLIQMHLSRPNHSGWKPHHHSGANLVKKVPAIQLAFEEKTRKNICPASSLCPKWRSDEFKAFSLLGSGGYHDPVYLMGFVHYDDEIHKESVAALANVNKKCVSAPGEIQMEDESVIESFNGGQMIIFPLNTSMDPNEFRVKLGEFIERTIPSHEKYIEGCTRSIHSMQDEKSKEKKGIRLSKEHFSQEIVERVTQEMEDRYQLKLVYKKSRGKQPEGYMRFASISW